VAQTGAANIHEAMPELLGLTELKKRRTPNRSHLLLPSQRMGTQSL
jgi:hypothetical protein